MQYTSRKRRMPSRKKIIAYWHNWLVTVGKLEPDEDPNKHCFACGWDVGSTQRAHIIPVCCHGSDSVKNLHLLCHWCHDRSEAIENYHKYYLWFKERNFFDVLCEACIKSGFIKEAKYHKLAAINERLMYPLNWSAPPTTQDLKTPLFSNILYFKSLP